MSEQEKSTGIFEGILFENNEETEINSKCRNNKK